MGRPPSRKRVDDARAEFDPLGQVERFASDVTPAVRAATGGP